MIKTQDFHNSNNKMSYLYLLTPKGISEKMALTEAFLKRKMVEYEVLRAEIASWEKNLDQIESMKIKEQKS